MGIEGDEITPEDVNTLKPVLKKALVNGFPELQWIKKGTDGIYISVHCGSGWEFLAIDTIPDYIDKHPLPAIGQSAVWQYRAIYSLEDENVGQWCDPISITVTGV